MLENIARDQCKRTNTVMSTLTNQSQIKVTQHAA